MSKDKDLEEFIKWGKSTGEKINSSKCFAGIVSKNCFNDPMMALQIGYAVLLEKPIILLVDKGVTVPQGLVKIAKMIESIDMKSKDGMAMAKASKSVQDFIKKYSTTGNTND